MPQMTVKLPGGKRPDVTDTPSNGQVLTFNSAKDLWDSQAGGVGGGGETFARVVKKVDETVTNSNTLQDDDELFFTPSINKTYWGYIIIYLVSGSVPDYRFNFTLPTGATGEKMIDSGLWRNTVQSTQDITSVESEATTAALQTFANYFRIIMGSTAGDVNYQFSQQTINAGATITKQGSTLVVYEETA